MHHNHRRQSGVVSLFVVIFATLLMTIVTVSFVRIMMQGQQQATINDLSQSAYDSSLAGVEDAKRAILQYQNLCSDPTKALGCIAAKSRFNSINCNDAVSDLKSVKDATTSGSGEVKIQTGSSTNSLDQAYTCTFVTLNTDDYKGALLKNEQKMIPLKGVEDFDTVKLQWFSQADVSGSINLSSEAAGVSLLSMSSWLSNRPPIMRAQLIQHGDNFTVGDFESGSSTTGSNSNTLFLYPTGQTGVALSPSFVNNRDFISDVRKLPTGKPVSIKCSGLLSTGGYSCAATLKLPEAVGSSDNNRTAFLRLTSLYNKANYRVALYNGNIPVKFKEVQPSIDSTGRANDLFRRVQARVELSTEFIYPDAAIHLTDNLCKDFLVTTNPDDYKNPCSPSIDPSL